MKLVTRIQAKEINRRQAPNYTKYAACLPKHRNGFRPPVYCTVKVAPFLPVAFHVLVKILTGTDFSHSNEQCIFVWKPKTDPIHADEKTVSV